MSEPPPGAVLITNSAALVGCCAAAGVGSVLAVVLTEGDGEPLVAPPPHAAPTRRAAPRIEDSRLMLECNMTCYLHAPVRSRRSSGLVRSDQGRMLIRPGGPQWLRHRRVSQCENGTGTGRAYRQVEGRLRRPIRRQAWCKSWCGPGSYR